MRKSRFSEEQIISILAEQERGMKTGDPAAARALRAAGARAQQRLGS